VYLKSVIYLFQNSMKFSLDLSFFNVNRLSFKWKRKINKNNTAYRNTVFLILVLLIP